MTMLPTPINLRCDVGNEFFNIFKSKVLIKNNFKKHINIE